MRRVSLQAHRFGGRRGVESGAHECTPGGSLESLGVFCEIEMGARSSLLF